MSGKLRVGNVEILCFTDALASLPLEAVFPNMDAARWQPYRERHPEVFQGEMWRVHVGCHLVQSQGRTVLVDTGVGPNPVPLLGGIPGKLLEEMRAADVGLEDIDTVFITHAHPDHVGWNMGQDGKPTFPRARYMLHQADWDALSALDTALIPALGAPYTGETIAPLKALDALELFRGETAITSELTAIETPGHTPGSASLLISSGGEKALVVGDTIVHPAMVSEPDIAFGFDFDPPRALATRRRLVERLAAEGLTMVSCHFPSPGFGRVVMLEGQRRWQAVA